MARRVLPILLAALVVASTGAAPASAATPSALLHLRAKGVPLGATNRFRDTILRRPPARAHAAVATGTDLTLKTPDGTALAVTISSQYGNSPQAAQAAQNTVNFLATRVHGSELASLRVFIGPPAEISSICGATEALACYAPNEQRMYVPGEASSQSGGFPVEYIITHEYGHHIANHRHNALGSAFQLGPEYWATSQFVCAGILSNPQVFFPGDEGDHYLDNPGEGWADSYAHLPENGFESAPFQFNPLFHRDATAFAAIRADVLQPWTKPPSRTVKGSFGSGSRKVFPLTVTVDGPLTARLSGPRGAEFDIQVRADGQTLGTTKRAGSSDSISGPLCATPSHTQPIRVQVLVLRRSGSGSFRLRLSSAG